VRSARETIISDIRRPSARTILVTAGVALVATGSGAAFAATGGHGHVARALRLRPGFLVVGPRLGGGGPVAAAATYLGLTPAELRSQLESGKTLGQIADQTSGKSASGLIGALVAAASKRIDAAVSAGKLTQSQAATFKTNLNARITALVNGTGHRHVGEIGHRGGLIKAAVTYLGITPQQLFTQLQSGKTLAQVADGTHGKSSGGLIDALVAATTKDIDAAVAAGKLTQSQASTFASNLHQRITAFVNHQPLGGRRFGRPGWPVPPVGANA
jgi:hypothetical protein